MTIAAYAALQLRRITDIPGGSGCEIVAMLEFCLAISDHTFLGSRDTSAEIGRTGTIAHCKSANWRVPFKSCRKRCGTDTMGVERWRQLSPSTTRILDSRTQSQAAFWQEYESTSRLDAQMAEAKRVLKSGETNIPARSGQRREPPCWLWACGRETGEGACTHTVGFSQPVACSHSVARRLS